LAPRIGAIGSSSWPTPKVATGDYSYSQGDHEKPVLNLEGAAKCWPTPKVGCHGEPGAGARHDTILSMWMTPTDVTKGGGKTRSKARSGEALLPGQAEAWATPLSRDWRSESGAPHGKHSPPLSRQVLRTETAGSDGLSKAVLNPCFVEALMGLPPSWTVPTVSAVSGMESYLCKQRLRLRRLLKGSGTARSSCRRRGR
jgi:hypothetical protein